jgi:hypothetical protein
MARQLARRRSEPVNPLPEDDETEEPATTRRNSRDDDSGTTRRTTRRDVAPDAEEDADESPRSGRSPDRKRQSESAPARSSGRGWDAYKKAKAKSSKWNDDDKLTVDEGAEELLVFLDKEPFETWNEHFIRELDGKKSWTCLDDDCPLCERGDSPGYRAAFNVAVFDDKGNPVVKFWIATPGPLDEIEEHAFSERYGPLNRPGNYFVVSKKKGKNKFFKYKIERITADQVESEFGFEPLTEDDLSALAEGAFESKDVLQVSSRKELRDVARTLDE